MPEYLQLILLILAAVLIAVFAHIRIQRVDRERSAQERAERVYSAATAPYTPNPHPFETYSNARARRPLPRDPERQVQGGTQPQARTLRRIGSSLPVDPLTDLTSPLSPLSLTSPISIYRDTTPSPAACEAPSYTDSGTSSTDASSSYDSSSSRDTGTSSSGSDW